MHFSRRVLVFLTTLATLIGFNLLAAAPAQAATSCSGTITHWQRFVYNPTGAVVGELIIYYNSSNGGTNSACFYHRGPSYGVYAQTDIVLYRCAQRSGEGQTCDTVAFDRDGGNYAYQAGPVGVTGTANYCVGAMGWIYWKGTPVGVFGPVTRGC